MLIDFASRPPVPSLDGAAPHLANYRRVYAASERDAAERTADDPLADYLAAYDRLGARHVVLKARDVESTFGFKVPNEAVAAFCREQGARFLGFAGVDAHKGRDAVREFEVAVRELGLRGLNLQCFEAKLCPNDRLFYPLYEKALELGVPVNIHVGINFSTATLMRYGRPEFLDEVLVDFPGLKVCASPPGWPWVHELIGVAWRHPTLWIGLLAVRPKLLAKEHSGYEPLLHYGRTILKDRIIFGSAFPMMAPERCVAEVEALPLEPTVRRKWLHDNAAAFLDLPAPGDG